MLLSNKSTSESRESLSLPKCIFVGGVIALAVISFFVFGVDNPNPEWGKLWRIRPLIITPLAGAMGGAFFYFMDLMGSRGVNRTFAFVMGLFGFIVALWLGTVLGLAGTMWN